MPKAFSVASWNVEHFKNAPRRVGDVIGLLASLDPDVFALYEVEGQDVFAELDAQMPGYHAPPPTCHSSSNAFGTSARKREGRCIISP